VKEISIRPRAQQALLIALLGAGMLAVGAQLPELKRYLKIRRM
jgi:hypothetical protein